MVHDRDSLGIEGRVHIMVDISDDTNVVSRRGGSHEGGSPAAMER